MITLQIMRPTQKLVYAFLIADITDPAIIDKILSHVHQFAPPASVVTSAMPGSIRGVYACTATANQPATGPAAPTDSHSDCNNPPTAPLTWAQRLKRVFDIDITLCPLCGGQLRVITHITDPDLIRKILDHVQKRAPPTLPPRRAPSDTTYPDLFAKRQ
ncbi:MAG: hypothetical protein IPM20_02095 [Gammaproteobacteria bacterium]|nr:hypothetical protein [Gammaproteobacteria bacterium]